MAGPALLPPWRVDGLRRRVRQRRRHRGRRGAGGGGRGDGHPPGPPAADQPDGGLKVDPGGLLGVGLGALPSVPVPLGDAGAL